MKGRKGREWKEKLKRKQEDNGEKKIIKRKKVGGERKRMGS